MVRELPPLPKNPGYIPECYILMSFCPKTVCHAFYEKPTKNEFVILASSALSVQTKRTVFTQEALRRMRNTSLLLGPEVANKFLSQYMLKLKDSGYSKKIRTQKMLLKFKLKMIRMASNSYSEIDQL